MGLKKSEKMILGGGRRVRALPLLSTSLSLSPISQLPYAPHDPEISISTALVKRSLSNANMVPLDHFHCHAIKKKSKTIQWKKLRNCDVVEDKKIRLFSKF